MKGWYQSRNLHTWTDLHKPRQHNIIITVLAKCICECIQFNQGAWFVGKDQLSSVTSNPLYLDAKIIIGSALWLFSTYFDGPQIHKRAESPERDAGSHTMEHHLDLVGGAGDRWWSTVATEITQRKGPPHLSGSQRNLHCKGNFQQCQMSIQRISHKYVMLLQVLLVVHANKERSNLALAVAAAQGLIRTEVT